MSTWAFAKGLEDKDFDFDFTIDGEQVGQLRDLLLVAQDALGDSWYDKELAAFADVLLQKLAQARVTQ